MAPKELQPQIISLSSQDIYQLRRQFEQLSEITSFKDQIKFSAKIASYGIFREVGTVNDELARFIFNAKTETPVSRQSLVADLVHWRGLTGVRIKSTETSHLELRTQGFYDVVHPDLSYNDDGTLHTLFIFPEIIQHMTSDLGVDLVLVKSWGLNSMFGGFDPRKEYYQTNFWELENNDALKFSDLVRKGQLTLMGTHDLIAHVAGIQSEQWPKLKDKAHEVFTALTEYIQTSSKPSIASLILPYTIGVVLDDLAQPPTYGSKSHLAVIDELLLKLKSNPLRPEQHIVLTEFPASFQKIIDLSRTAGVQNKPDEIKTTVQQMMTEILGKSYVT